ncbi:MAG TPA: hypothetical protein VNE86_06690 [Nitrososphaerales archaeon]|nr:hypothetical protein [Nitrososphaerales archaeon]
MSKETPRKKYWAPSSFWIKPPSGPSPLLEGFKNEQQKKFYVVVTVFKVAKVAAIAVIALFLIGRL